MNPIQLIKKDHANVKALFRRFEKADRNAERQKLGQEIIEELSVHSVMEEQLIYPLLRERDARVEDQVLDALEEHHAVKLILAELDDLRSDHERYRAKVHVVRESVEMHIEEEEAKLLPRLEAALTPRERTRLAEAIASMKVIAPTHPHPGAPDAPPGIVSGLIAKVADSAVDVVQRFTSPQRAAAHRAVARRARSGRVQPAQRTPTARRTKTARRKKNTARRADTARRTRRRGTRKARKRAAKRSR